PVRPGSQAAPRRPAVAVSLPEPAGRSDDPPAVLAGDRRARPGGRDPGPHLPARAAAFVRDASPRARRGPALGPDDARPRRYLDDADLHARLAGPAARGLRRVSPPRAQKKGPPRRGPLRTFGNP